MSNKFKTDYASFNTEIYRLNKKLEDKGSSYKEKIEDVKNFCKTKGMSLEEYVELLEERGVTKIKITDYSTEEEKELQLRLWAIKIFIITKARSNKVVRGLL